MTNRNPPYSIQKTSKFLQVFILWQFYAGWAISSYAEKLKISAIETVGNKKIETSAMFEKINSTLFKGMSAIKLDGTSAPFDFDTQQTKEWIKVIFGMGYFDQVKLLLKNDSGKNILRIEVQERPFVQAIEYQGLSSLSNDDFKEDIDLKIYHVLDYAKIKSTLKKMTKRLEEKGFYLAQVKFELQNLASPNEVKVIFKIIENDKIMVKSVMFTGNKAFKDDRLRSIMQTQPGDFFSFMSDSGNFSEMLLERDVQILNYWYYNNGYVQVHIGEPRIEVSPDKRWVFVSIDIEEGPQYHVGNVDFGGDLIFGSDELLDSTQLKTEDTFSSEKLKTDILTITDKYGDKGFAFANVIPQHQVNPTTQTVDIHYNIDKGHQYTIGLIQVTGNDRTWDKVVRRELRIHEGEIYNKSLINLSKASVTRLGFFEDISFLETPRKDLEDVVDIEIKVKERGTNTLTLSAGVSQAGLFLDGQVSFNNFVGSGRSLSTKITYNGEWRREAIFSFQEPYLFDSKFIFGVDMQWVRTNLMTAMIRVDQIQGNLNLGRRLSNETQAFLAYRLVNNSLVPASDQTYGAMRRRAPIWRDQATGQLIDIESSRCGQVVSYTANDCFFLGYDSLGGEFGRLEGYTSALSTTFNFDSRNNRLDPSGGQFHNLGVEYAGLGGINHFLKMNYKANYFNNFFWKFVLRSNFEVGHIYSFDKDSAGNPLPPPTTERYFMGGFQNLRGYNPFEIAPSSNLFYVASDLSTTGLAKTKDVLVGGNSKILAQLEIEFPIVEEARLRGVFFADAGNAFNDLKLTGPVLYANYGFGFRWFSPMGMLRFEFAFPTVSGTTTNLDTGPKFVFMIGPPF